MNPAIFRDQEGNDFSLYCPLCTQLLFVAGDLLVCKSDEFCKGKAWRKFSRVEASP